MVNSVQWNSYIRAVLEEFMDIDRTAALVGQWEEIINGVREASNITTNVSFEAWLKPLEVASYINDTLTIYIPEKLVHLTDYLNNQFSLHIKVQTAEHLNVDVLPEIVFLLKPEAAPASFASPEKAQGEAPFNPAETLLNPRYRFESFVVGSNNNFAHSASLAVAESPGRAYNPLFLYGGPGLGKTHLMHSIAHMIMENNPSAKVLYVTSEHFTNEVIESIRSGKAERMTNLREKYRNVDVLMVDDVQFIIGKDATQDEFFHTFNTLHQAGKQIVISSDRPPKEIETLEERLRSRFEMGLVADIQPPNYETRMAILRKNAENNPYSIDDKIFEYIAENVTTNIRELEGAYNKIIAFARLHEVEMTFENAQEALKDIIDPAENKALTLDRIVEAVCDHYQISREEITSKKRVAEIVLPRQVAMYLCRQLLSASLEEIGDGFGGKDHTTVINAVEKIKLKVETDDALRKNVELLRKKLSPETRKT